MNKSQKQIAGVIAIIGILAVSSIVAWEVTLPPIEIPEYEFVSIDDCETLNNITETYPENYTFELNSIACEGDYSITYATSKNLSSIPLPFDIRFKSDYDVIGFYLYISNASNLELLNVTQPVGLTIENITSFNLSTCYWNFTDFEVGCNNLSATFDELNITDAYIDHFVITIKSGKFVQMGAYGIDEIYAMYEV